MSPAPSDEQPTPDARLVGRRTHREPRYGSFILTGALAGVLAAVVLTLTQLEDGASHGSVLGYLAVALGALGALLGGVVASVIGAVIDRRRRGR